LEIKIAEKLARLREANQAARAATGKSKQR
jgi:hypothetical protein